MKYKGMDKRGFTLVEIIIFLVLLGIFAVFVVQYVGTAARGSLAAVNWLRDEVTLQGVMEDIVAEYKSVITNSSDDSITSQSVLSDLKTYAETHHAAYVYGSETGYITFNAQGAASNISQTMPSQDPVLIITVKNGDQKLFSLFTASE